MTESHRPVAGHDAWFRAKVQEALDDPRPAIPHDPVEAHFATRRAPAARKVRAWPVRLEWSAPASEDRNAIFDYIEADNPSAAIGVDDRIREKVGRLSRFPELGRPRSEERRVGKECRS